MGLMMLIMFMMGAIIGSFLNVCIYRIPIEKSIISPPSSCTNCGNRLKPLELIPIISYLLQGGKCKNCGTKISIKYPLIEALTGALFVFAYYNIGLQLSLLRALVVMSSLIVVTFIDFEYSIIPDEVNLFIFITGIMFNIFIRDISIADQALGILVGGGILLLIATVTGGAMGGGDIKLMAAMGVYLGPMKMSLALFLGFILGAFIGVALVITKIKGRKDYIPFGPYLVTGSLISLFYGNEILYWYLSRF